MTFYRSLCCSVDMQSLCIAAADNHRHRTEDSNAIENVNVEDLKTAKHTVLISNSHQSTPLIYVDVIIAMATVALSRLRYCGR